MKSNSMWGTIYQNWILQSNEDRADEEDANRRTSMLLDHRFITRNDKREITGQ
jgi:hypothetical protein